MGISIYLDDSLDWNLLIALLRQAGHTVISPRDVGTSRSRDPKHLEYAAQHGYVLLTKNPRDFDTLHQQWQAQGRAHAGILQVHADNVAYKDMKPHDIVRAIANLLASGLPIANEVHILNQWH